MIKVKKADVYVSAVSGGVDSATGLHLLKSVVDKESKVVAVHLVEDEKCAARCEERCKKLGVELLKFQIFTNFTNSKKFW